MSTWALSSSSDWSLREFWAVRIDEHGNPIKLTEAEKARGLVDRVEGRSAEEVAAKRDEQDHIEEGTT